MFNARFIRRQNRDSRAVLIETAEQKTMCARLQLRHFLDNRKGLMLWSLTYGTSNNDDKSRFWFISRTEIKNTGDLEVL